MEGKLQFHSHPTLMAEALVPCWNQLRVHIFESSQLEGSYVGGFLYREARKERVLWDAEGVP